MLTPPYEDQLQPTSVQIHWTTDVASSSTVRFGATPAALLWCGFVAVLVALAGIDWDTTLLPDNLTLPLLWAGLLAALSEVVGAGS